MTAAHSEIWVPPQLWDKDFIVKYFEISDKRLDKLISEGKVGCINTRPRKFTAEHFQQIMTALELKPVVEPVDDLTLIGVSPVSAARYRRNRARAGQ